MNHVQSVGPVYSDGKEFGRAGRACLSQEGLLLDEPPDLVHVLRVTIAGWIRAGSVHASQEWRLGAEGRSPAGPNDRNSAARDHRSDAPILAASMNLFQQQWAASTLKLSLDCSQSTIRAYDTGRARAHRAEDAGQRRAEPSGPVLDRSQRRADLPRPAAAHRHATIIALQAREYPGPFWWGAVEGNSIELVRPKRIPGKRAAAWRSEDNSLQTTAGY